MEKKVAPNSGTPQGFARIFVSAVEVLVGDDRRRLIEITDLDVEIVGERLKVLRPKVGGRPRDVARVCLLDGELPHRAPFHLIGLEQLWARDPFQHHRQLPRQVVSVVDPGVTAKAAIGRHQMRGIAGQKHAPLAEAPRHV